MLHEGPAAPGEVIRRHGVATRVWHWINAVAIFVMIGSGLGILNAHPRLYWGRYGANFDAAWLELPRTPGWLTIPASYNLALSRRWHLLFALVLGFALLGYMVASVLNRHFRRQLVLKRGELAPAHLLHDVREHLALRFHDAERPAAYNTLQKLSYAGTVFVLLPLLVATGIAMSPGLNAAFPWLLDLLGGRQSARSLHFIAMVALVGFVVIHLTLVILAGVGNEVRSMLTGRWRVPEIDR